MIVCFSTSLHAAVLWIIERRLAWPSVLLLQPPNRAIIMTT